ncbi:MAG: hypothetical protein Q9228_006733, partial [Teloschistes exilis]
SAEYSMGIASGKQLIITVMNNTINNITVKTSQSTPTPSKYPTSALQSTPSTGIASGKQLIITVKNITINNSTVKNISVYTNFRTGTTSATQLIITSRSVTQNTSNASASTGVTRTPAQGADNTGPISDKAAAHQLRLKAARERVFLHEKNIKDKMQEKPEESQRQQEALLGNHMAGSDGTVKARVLLKAVDLALSAEVPSLQQLVAREPDILAFELVLRILLTYLPESTDPTLYVDLLQQLVRGTVHEPPRSTLRPVPPEREWSDEEACHQARQLHLLPIAEEQDLQAGCTDQLSLFLLHRARRIDVETGSIHQIQQLLRPFVDHDPYIRTWLVSNLLPLRRLDYEYYPQNEGAYTVEAFEKLDGRPAIDALLARSLQNSSPGPIQASRDIRAVVGPWIYGVSRRKRRKTHHDRRRSFVTVPETGVKSAMHTDHAARTGWPDVNGWIVDLALRNFSWAAETIEGWDGPNDVDYDGYINDLEQSDDNTDGIIEHYAQAGLAAIYATTEFSQSALERSYSILQNVARRSGLQPPPGLDNGQWEDVSSIPQGYINQITELHLLHNTLLKPGNPLTICTQASIALASLILNSNLLLHKLGQTLSCRDVSALALFGKPEGHAQELHTLLQKVPTRTRDEVAWAEVRDSVLKLRDWRYETSDRASHDAEATLGVLCRLKREDVEVELLKAILGASCYDLAVHIYCLPDEGPIPADTLKKTVLGVAMSSYDGASNGNRTRGGIRTASEIVTAFQNHFPASQSFAEANALIAATHAMSFYSLTLQHGVPFQPVNVRTTKDPLSLIGKILEQNPRSYTKLDDLIEIGQNLVRAGPGPKQSQHKTSSSDHQATSSIQTLDQKLLDSSSRITSMAIEAALTENDFDTAYSYIINRLSPTTSANDSSPSSSTPEDDISWRAAFLAGRFSPSTQSITSPSSFRRPEQRLELLSLALILAPSSHLPEILTVWRGVEADLTAVLAREAAEEDSWNARADRGLTGSTTLPGGFSSPSMAELDKVSNQQRPRRQSRATAAAAANEEAPMGLFDVARGAAQAFRKNAFPLNAAAAASPTRAKERPLSIVSDEGGSGGEGKAERVRKRDLVANAVTGGLASGIGWVIGAPSPTTSGRS